jgi:hypothetical protein
MKHLLNTLAAAAAAFVLGCQDPSVTDPVATGYNAAGTTIAKPQPIVDQNQLEFNQEVLYTNGDRSRPVMQAIGKINFHINQVPILSDELFDVEITANGVLHPSNTDAFPWSFKGSSTDRIRILSGTKVQFEKNFLVYGADVPSVLTMRFTVTERTLALRTMSLTAKKKNPVSILPNPR